MLDAPPAPGSVPGHNHPPPFDPDVVAGFRAKVATAAETAGAWLDVRSIESDDAPPP